jgi:hypothetical protein
LKETDGLTLGCPKLEAWLGVLLKEIANIDCKALELLIKRLSRTQPERFTRASHIAIVFFQGLSDYAALVAIKEIVEVFRRNDRGVYAVLRVDSRTDVLRSYVPVVIGVENCALNFCRQLSNITGPRILL